MSECFWRYRVEQEEDDEETDTQGKETAKRDDDEEGQANRQPHLTCISSSSCSATKNYQILYDSRHTHFSSSPAFELDCLSSSSVFFPGF